MPLQTWVPEEREELTLRTEEFLREQKYGKQSKLESALPGMFEVIKHSDIITIFLISNGAGRCKAALLTRRSMRCIKTR